MNICLSHESALQFYRRRNPEKSLSERNTVIPHQLVPSLTAPEATWLARSFDIDLPVTASVTHDNLRRRNQRVHSLTHLKEIPPHHYRHLGKSTYVASPELALAQTAASLAMGRIRFSSTSNLWTSEKSIKLAPVIAIAAIGSELASNYALDNNCEDGFRRCKPCLKLDSLDQLLEESGFFRGKAILKNARPFMLENANAPSEVELGLFTSLPKTWGGRGIRILALNKPVSTRYGNKTLTRMPDLLLGDSKTVLEYNGGYHEGERANEDDARRNELIDAGYRVLVVNKEQLHNADFLDRILDTAEESTGSWGRKGKNHIEKRTDMRRLIFELCGTDCIENSRLLVPKQLRP